MKIFHTNDLHPDGPPYSQTEKTWVYNGLDCMVTFEVNAAIDENFDNSSRLTYELSRELLGPVLDMNMRGVLIDQEYKDALTADYDKDLSLLSAHLSRIVQEGIGLSPFNWRSNPNLLQLFYEELGLPPIRRRNDNGQLVPTVDREALERLQDYLYAQPIVAHLFALRDLGKKISFLRTGIDPDGRIRTSYNIGGTTTDRLSSSFSEFGTGTNLQNIEQRLRRVFWADPGHKFCNIDLEQSDSRALGAIEWDRFADPTYLNMCESGDLHTSVCKLVWKNVPWTGNRAADRQLADGPFYRQHSRRHMAKVLGHGTNFLGQPSEMFRHTKIPVSEIKEFQGAYFAAIPCHQRWHAWVAETLLSDGHLTNLFGRRRRFFGRRTDPETIRKAVAFEPQSTTAGTINRAMLRAWRLPNVQLLLQVHDSILVQYPDHLENEIVPALLRCFDLPHYLRDNRRFIIPAEAKVGWNWADADDVINNEVVRVNPDGLVKFNGNDIRSRLRTPNTPKLDKRLFGTHL